MRIGIVSIVQTSNSFSATRTTLDDFQRCRLASGRDVVAGSGFQDPVAGALAQFLAGQNLDVIPVAEALASAGGPLSDSAAEGICNQLGDGVRQAGDLDRVILHLSGSLLYGDNESASQLFAAHLRAILPVETPVMVLLDRNANFVPQLLEFAELVLTVQEPAGSELPEAAIERIERALVASGSSSLHTSHRGPLFLVPLPNQTATNPAIRRIEEVRQTAEMSPGVVSANVSYGFPYADTPSAGASVWVTAFSPDAAAEAAETLAAALMSERDELEAVRHLLNVEEAVHIAMANPDSRYILLDTGDDPTAGAPGDGTGLLWGLLDLGAQGAILAPLVDPAAVELAFSTGEGNVIGSDIGARIDRRHGYPVNIRGKVVRLIEALPGHDSGRVALVEAEGRHHGSVLIVLTERRTVLDNLAILNDLGIDLRQFPIIAIKASTPPDHDSIASGREFQTLSVATPGITVPDFGYFPYRRLAANVRPVLSRQDG